MYIRVGIRMGFAFEQNRQGWITAPGPAREKEQNVNNGAIVLAVNKVKGRHLAAVRGHEVQCLELVMVDS